MAVGDQLQLSISQVQSAPLDYVVPNAQLIELLCANAVFDGTSAASAFLPELVIISDSGHTVARSIVGTQVAAGGSAEVTFAPFLGSGSGGGGGGSAGGPILLLPLAAMLPDGSASNLAPSRLRVQGTEANPKKTFPVLSFLRAAGAQLDSAVWAFRLPSNYVSGGTIDLLWMTSVTAGNVVWQAQVACVTAGDADTPIEHAFAAASSVTSPANATEANRLISASITIASMDGATAGDLIFVRIFRNSGSGSDTCLGDANLIAATFEFS